MTRIRADLCLLLVAFIWGTAFIAQKTGMDGIGPFTFVTCRFLLSFLFILPFCYIECRNRPRLTRRDVWLAIPVCLACAIGVCLQQVGLQTASVTNAGFITSLYVVFTPLVIWVLFRQRPGLKLAAACGLAVGGLWLLTGASAASLAAGDLLILACALCFGFHVALTGWYLKQVDRPIFVSAVQYLVTVISAFVWAGLTERIDGDAIMQNLWPLLYAGIISGGIAYTLQAVAQRHTPASNAALILSLESIFAAAAGFLILDETMTTAKFAGAVLIVLAVILVEMRFRQKAA